MIVLAFFVTAVAVLAYRQRDTEAHVAEFTPDREAAARIIANQRIIMVMLALVMVLLGILLGISRNPSGRVSPGGRPEQPPVEIRMETPDTKEYPCPPRVI